VCTVYVHVDTVTVRKGDVVAQGQQIATSGNTGTGGNAHLHFAVDNCAWQSLPSSFVEAGVPLSSRMVTSANPTSSPPPLVVNPVDVGQVVAVAIDPAYAGGASVSRMSLRVDFDDGVLDYISASSNPNGGGFGFLRWNDIAPGETMYVSFVTTDPGSGSALTATVVVYTDPDGAGPLPEIEVTSGADGVSWEITAPPEPEHLVGTVYHDLDGDGLRDITDPPLAGVTVEAWYDDGDGQFEPNVDDYLSTSVTTDEFGQYDLEVPPGLPFWVVPGGDEIDGALATNGTATLDTGDALTLGYAWPSVQIIAVAEDRPDGAALILPGPYPVTVTFNYTVRNTGETALRDLIVSDDVGTPLDTGDDAVVCSLAGPLPAGAETTCSLTRSVDGPGVSIAQVTATPTGWAPDATGPAVGDSDAAEIQRLADGTNPDLRADVCGSDIVLVLDESGSVNRWRTTFTQAARNFIAGVVDTGTRVAVVEFSTTATLVVPYTEVTSGGLGTISTVFDPYLDTGYYPNGFTNWKGALEVVRDEMTSPSTVFFVTDGNPNILDSAWVSETSATEGAAAVADNLKAQGVHMFAVAVGRSPDIEFVEAISGPDRYPGADFGSADYAASIRIDLLDEMMTDYGSQVCTP
ncbi:MAG: VWA domain-containing protein, partial [Acidimicrobiia bacterium]|nr:VWA domain-containing protein [Acidimicrobiia bacterium]